MEISPETVTRLWEQYGPALVLYARQWCETPEDVVQEAFLLLVRQPTAPDSPSAWLHRVVRNRAINAARSVRRQTRREVVVAVGRQPWFEAAEGNRLDAAAATAALKELSEDERKAIIARLWGGLSFEEIAVIGGVSVSTAYRCYQRGLKSLQERLGWSCPKKSKTGR